MAGGVIDEEKWVARLGAGLILCCFGNYEEALSSLIRCHQLSLHSESQSHSISDQCRTDVAARALREAVGEICKEAEGLWKAYKALIGRFRRYNSCFRSARAWSALFVGWSLYEAQSHSADDIEQWLKLSLDLAAASPNTEQQQQLCYIQCKANHLLYQLTPEAEWERELNHLTMWREAAARWGKLDEQVYALGEYWRSCSNNDKHDEAIWSREKFRGLVMEDSNDTALQAMFEGRCAWTTFLLIGESKNEECIDYCLRAVRRVVGFLRGTEKSWSGYFSYCATPGLSPPSSPTRDFWLFWCLQGALYLIVLVYSKAEIGMALTALARYKQLIKIGSGMFSDTEEMELWRLECLCEVLIDRCELKRGRWFDRAESVIAETLQLSASTSKWITYINALAAAIRLAEVNILDDFYFQHGNQVHHGVFEMIESFHVESQRLARRHQDPSHTFPILFGQAANFFRMQKMDKVVGILEPLVMAVVERGRKLGSFSWERIRHTDRSSDAFEMLQTALICCEQPDRALMWVERERAQDLLHNIKMNKRSAKVFEEKIDEFNLDDAKAMLEIKSITRNAGEDTAFLVYTSLIENHGINGFFLHQNVNQAWFTKFDQALNIWADVQRIAESLNSQNIDDTTWSLTRLQEWYKHLIFPFEEALEEMKPKKLVIVPGQNLSGLPFAALYKGAGDPFLIEKYAISYIPSLRVYAHCKHRGQTLMGRLVNSSFRAMVIGNPETGTGAPDLPYADQEAVVTKALLQEAGFQNINLLQKNTATKFAFLENLPASDWIHYAGHAVVSKEFPNGALLLAPENSELRSSSSDSSSNQNLSEADGQSRRMRLMRYACSRPSSEVLTGDDITSSKVEVRALVTVLSACQSGLGEACSEGVLGMYRALHVAGAPAVLCSLWNLDDACSMQFMEKLYQKLLEGDELAIALQKVVVEYIDDGVHENSLVRNWGAYIISGNPEMKLG